jgi:tartrate dehydrogenase/decarboxylase/D-malate dehydrogenase
MTKYRIAVIPGDGIGNEVVPAGIEVLEKVGGKLGIEFQWDEFDWPACRTMSRSGDC